MLRVSVHVSVTFLLYKKSSGNLMAYIRICHDSVSQVGISSTLGWLHPGLVHIIAEFPTAST